jgi:hypothetical protein
LVLSFPLNNAASLVLAFLGGEEIGGAVLVEGEEPVVGYCLPTSTVDGRKLTCSPKGGSYSTHVSVAKMTNFSPTSFALYTFRLTFTAFLEGDATTRRCRNTYKTVTTSYTASSFLPKAFIRSGIQS